MKRKIILFLTACLCLVAKASVSVGGLHIDQPQMGTDREQPRLSWLITSDQQAVLQTAYHVLVASSPAKLAKNEGDLWDSGKVSSDMSHLVPYNGKPLKSNQRCYWKVKAYTNRGVTDWSEASFWSMGLLGETQWKGQWIGMDHPAPWDSETQWSRLSARYLRREFKIGKQVVQATVHICGLGLYELFINGRRIGEQVLAPVPTDFRKSVTCNSFDVTPFLKAENAIGVTLGNGRFYTMRQNYKPYKITNFGYPKMRLNLIIEYADGTQETIASDTNWRLTADGPIRSNNEYDGEEYDARKELGDWASAGYDDSAWQQAERVSIPEGTLRAATTPNMKIVGRLKPASIKELKVGTYIIDMGQNMAGWIRMRVKGNPGDTIRLRFGERLQEDGELDVRNLRDARATDTYIVRGNEDGAQWAPRFVYHGFRYVELSGYRDPSADDFTGEVVSDEMNVAGTFACSDEMLNRIYRNAFRGIRSNYKGMPVDCPQRNERQPWLGDHVMGSYGESFIFDNAALYAKWMNDICEAQREDGSIPDVAPAYWNYYTDNMTWPATLPIDCEMLYTQYGDMQPIIRSYPAIKRWLALMTKEYMGGDYIITRDKYGDWCAPNGQTDGSLIATAYGCKVLELMVRFAGLQHLESDAQQYKALYAKMKSAFNHKFLTVKRGTSPAPGHPLYPDSIYYGNNTVTANVLPLAFGLVPDEYRDEVRKNVITAIITPNKGRISTGVIGTQWLMHTLSEMGNADVACSLATNKAYPGWGYMVEKGATTIWELWNGDKSDSKMNSGNHVMLLGDLISWYYEHLGGIRSSREKTGFKHIIFRPDFDIQELAHVEASYETPYGRAASKWSKTPMHLEWDVTVPANTTAEVWLPNGKTIHTGSGTYHYSVDIPTRNKAIRSDEFLYESAPFPECHAATIAETPGGDLVTAFFGGTKERNPDVCIWVCRKEKGSDRWTAPVEVVNGVIDATKRKACWNPVLCQIPGDDLLLFYKTGTSVADWTAYIKRSSDGGKTWSEPQQMPDGFLGPSKNKPEYIDGRLICPSSTEGDEGWKIHFELSDDKGKTWKYIGPIPAEEAVLTQMQGGKPAENKDDQEAGKAVKEQKRYYVYAIQPSILKLKDGRLQVLARTRNGYLATSYSSDNGETWSKVALTGLPSNNSGADAVTLKDGRHLLVYNDFRTLPGTPKGPRTPLSVAVSKDGRKWKKVMTLEDSPVSQYSYPAVIQGRDGTVHIVYTWRRQRIKYVKVEL